MLPHADYVLAGLCTGTSAILLLDPPEIHMERSAPSFISYLSPLQVPLCPGTSEVPHSHSSQKPPASSPQDTDGFLGQSSRPILPPPPNPRGYSSHFLPPHPLHSASVSLPVTTGVYRAVHTYLSTYYVRDREYHSNMTGPSPYTINHKISTYVR